jgi:NADP-dependent 3-hydroxy acid dehydrogenase YdfG
LTRDLIKCGWKVTGLDIIPSEDVIRAMDLGSNFMYINCDVTKYDQMANAFSQTFEKWKRIDAYLSNAGIIDKSSVYVYKYKGKTE